MSSRQPRTISCPRVMVITGTDTGVGKTVLTSALLRYGRGCGREMVGLKPLCSGDRADARKLLRAAGAGGGTDLNDINPWYWKAALAPGVVARGEIRPPRWREVVQFIRSFCHPHRLVLVEGAGGLLSPLTVDGDTSDLIRALRALPVVVCPNRLGAINQVLLVWKALPAAARRGARVVLMSQARPDRAAESNLAYLRERLGEGCVVELPWLTMAERTGRAPFRGAVRRSLAGLVAAFE